MATVASAVGGCMGGVMTTYAVLRWGGSAKREQSNPPSVSNSAVGEALPHNAHCIYLDWNATSPIFPEVTRAMAPFIAEHFGNPSSGHVYGKACGLALESARKSVGALVGARDPATEIVFTGCGSEADNMAIRGAVVAARKAKRNPAWMPHVVTSNIEHPAVTACLRAMAAEEPPMCNFTAVPVDGEGLLDPAVVAAAVIPGRTVLVTVMHSNNEVGSIQPLAAIAVAARRAAASGSLPLPLLVHTDAAQSFGKVRVNATALDVDMVTIVGHKFGAPKGIGALYVRRGVKLEPLVHGGGQENGRRAGTECVPLCVALGTASDIVRAEAEPLARHMRAMRGRLRARLSAALGAENVRINGPAAHEIDDGPLCMDDPLRSLPNTLSIGLRGVVASVLLEELNCEMAASASAACHTADIAESQASVKRCSNSAAERKTTSFVLTALGVPYDFALGTLRLSVGRHTTLDEVDRGADLITASAKRQLQQQN